MKSTAAKPRLEKFVVKKPLTASEIIQSTGLTATQRKQLAPFIQQAVALYRREMARTAETKRALKTSARSKHPR